MDHRPPISVQPDDVARALERDAPRRTPAAGRCRCVEGCTSAAVVFTPLCRECESRGHEARQ